MHYDFIPISTMNNIINLKMNRGKKSYIDIHTLNNNKQKSSNNGA